MRRSNSLIFYHNSHTTERWSVFHLWSVRIMTSVMWFTLNMSGQILRPFRLSASLQIVHFISSVADDANTCSTARVSCLQRRCNGLNSLVYTQSQAMMQAKAVGRLLALALLLATTSALCVSRPPVAFQTTVMWSGSQQPQWIAQALELASKQLATTNLLANGDTLNFTLVNDPCNGAAPAQLAHQILTLSPSVQSIPSPSLKTVLRSGCNRSAVLNDVCRLVAAACERARAARLVRRN